MRYILAILLAVLLIGCTQCKRCQGESLDFGNDLVLNATESANFKQLLLGHANRDLDGFVNLLFLVATGSSIPTGNSTITINTAQWNRWLNKGDKGSFASKSIFNQINNSVKMKEPMLSSAYIADATSQATLHIANQAKRTRFLSLLNGIYGTEEF